MCSKINSIILIFKLRLYLAQLAWPVEYADYTSAEWEDPLPHKECSGYNTKLSKGEVLILEVWWMWSTLSLLLLPDPL